MCEMPYEVRAAPLGRCWVISRDPLTPQAVDRKALEDAMRALPFDNKLVTESTHAELIPIFVEDLCATVTISGALTQKPASERQIARTRKSGVAFLQSLIGLKSPQAVARLNKRKITLAVLEKRVQQLIDDAGIEESPRNPRRHRTQYKAQMIAQTVAKQYRSLTGRSPTQKNDVNLPREDFLAFLGEVFSTLDISANVNETARPPSRHGSRGGHFEFF